MPGPDDTAGTHFVAVVPCGAHDVARFCLLWASLLETPHPLSQIVIVATPATRRRMERIVRDDPRVRWMRDADVVPAAAGVLATLARRQAGYRTQMLAKLWVAAQLPANATCVTLDADVLLWRPLERDDVLAPSGLPWAFPERPSRHPAWYAAASRILGLPGLDCSHWVTPCMLSPGVAAGVLDRLRDRLGPLWRYRMVANPARWTEYSLYHTFALHLERTEGEPRHEVGQRARWVHPLLYRAERLRGVAAELRDPDGAPFTLMNSRSGLQAMEILSALEPIRPEWGARARHLLQTACAGVG